MPQNKNKKETFTQAAGISQKLTASRNTQCRGIKWKNHAENYFIIQRKLEVKK